MRYIINTEDKQGLIGIQIGKWAKEGQLTVVEKGEPLVELKEHLEKVARALEVLRKAGYNSHVMRTYIYQETKISKREVDAILKSQEDFFRQIGVMK